MSWLFVVLQSTSHISQDCVKLTWVLKSHFYGGLLYLMSAIRSRKKTFVFVSCFVIHPLCNDGWVWRGAEEQKIQQVNREMFMFIFYDVKMNCLMNRGNMEHGNQPVDATFLLFDFSYHQTIYQEYFLIFYGLEGFLITFFPSLDANPCWLKSEILQKSFALLIFFRSVLLQILNLDFFLLRRQIRK